MFAAEVSHVQALWNVADDDEGPAEFDNGPTQIGASSFHVRMRGEGENSQ